ncbi:hypothetical protein [Endozoicomonas euniceicola]|uniref:Glycerol kinase n=1 Tax=Endozoicomonas euniceicola TaxID=1234143 RepID=A0ABY6GUB6_9GAMM|nr:hypothetical protein [Endozoicomonas euniceicola]UYM16349.1 hypothetical protein NX720_26750 [Endozoicomonas euniceicola]
MSNKTQKISTSALAKAMSLSSKELFQKMESSGWISRQGDQWKLTEQGEAQGGEYFEHPKYGTYIVWPQLLHLSDSNSSPSEPKLLTASAIGHSISLPARRVNALLSELGWIKKSMKGWQVTPQGQLLGGHQQEDYRSGVPYATWPKSIIEHKALQLSLKEIKGDLSHAIGLSQPADSEVENFRSKFPAKLRSADGHMVRSKAEMLIDNWLYIAEIVHAYERKLPVDEDVYCDFYIPTGKVYIEFWGLENDKKYQKRKAEKIKIYEKYNLNLIQLNDNEIQNLDDVLPRLLLKFGVQTY